MTAAPVWKSLLSRPVFEGDEEKTRRAAVSYDLLVFTFLLVLVMQSILFVTKAYADFGIMALGYSALIWIPILIWQLKQGRLSLVVGVVAGALWLIAVVGCWRLGTIRVAHTTLVLPALLYVMAMFGARVAGAYFLFCLSSFGVLAYLETTGVLTGQGAPSPLVQWVVLFYTGSAVFAYMKLLQKHVLDPIERRGEQARKELAERHQASQSLEQSKQELEQMVEARTKELREALTAARSATVAKSQFLAMMSHEIRTPMHGVVGIAELLLKSPLDEQQTRYVTSLLRAGTALSSLINDILDFSKIEAGRMDFEAAPLNPSALLEETVAMIQQQANAKGLAIRLLMSPQVPEAIVGDPTRLRQIWLNLLSNAVKFTESGSVTVSLSVRFGDDDSLRLFSMVRDTGIGISKEAMSNLFEPFGQADSSTTRRFGGTGLGLVICKRLVEHMGGAMTVDSEVGKGTAFAFEWPVKELKGVNPAFVNTAPGDLNGLPKMRVLLVDDNALNRMLALGQFKELGHEDVRVAEDGQQALDWLEKEIFDVVFMDMQMPGMDGLEATRRLRKMPLKHQPVVVAMTANAYEEDRQNCIEAGMDHFLPKPVKLKTLRQALTYARRV